MSDRTKNLFFDALGASFLVFLLLAYSFVDVNAIDRAISGPEIASQAP